MHTCIYTYTYRHTYILTYTHIQIHTYIYIMHTHIHMHIHTYSLIECSNFVALLWFGYELSLTGSILYWTFDLSWMLPSWLQATGDHGNLGGWAFLELTGPMGTHFWIFCLVCGLFLCVRPLLHTLQCWRPDSMQTKPKSLTLCDRPHVIAGRRLAWL